MSVYRIATLNIRHGGKKHAEALRTRLLGYEADLLIVTEYRANDAGEYLVSQLRSVGYATSHGSQAPERNAVLIASRQAIDRAWPLDESLDSERLWCAAIAGTVVCGVLFPNKEAKYPYWGSVIDAARRGGIDLFAGDFNTGNNALDKDPKGTPFLNSDMPRRLIDCGYVDLWRSRHPRLREYSWFHSSGNGFRLDHVFATNHLARKVSSCEFDHAPRLRGETDHSALVVAIDCETP